MTLTLEASKSIQGVAGSATAITCTVFGDEISGTTNTYKMLAQNQLAASAGVVYNPSGVSAIVKTIVLVNTTGAGVTATIYVGGTAAANSIGSFTVPANGQAIWGSSGWVLKDANGATITTSTTILTGDLTGTGTSSIATTLATVNSNVGSFGDASHVTVLTVNGKGLVTAANSTAIAIASGAVSGLGPLAAIANLTGDVTTTGGAATTLATVNANTGAWGSASSVPIFTVNAKGLVTAASNTSIAIAAGAVSGLNAMATTNLSGDVSSSGATTTLATVNSNTGAFGDASHVATFTVNGKGLTTAAGSTAIALDGGSA